ncbi:hypothetical protein [Brevibacillus massiliensis]|uniref:hypothetical protein n=1 Tax=Brevibacillus massiliensis TaxID=1118054 RepID=UPI001375F7A8|nr:hypothetical protein [Brevibacillus massiliensis]
MRTINQLFEIPCHEYTPELQIRLLGIELSQLQEPILNIGAGKEGKLVRFLRENGCEAYGIDKFCETDGYMHRADWLSFSFEANTWGTVISHMAFSNHFRHHHLRRDGQPRQYAEKYMEILHSIKHAGSFYYAPGLPFIEDLLPAEQFAVRRTPVIPGKDDQSSWFGYPYAAQVTVYR